MVHHLVKQFVVISTKDFVDYGAFGGAAATFRLARVAGIVCVSHVFFFGIGTIVREVEGVGLISNCLPEDLGVSLGKIIVW